MSDRYFAVKVGDHVMINPKYWSEVESSGLVFSEPYRSNGPDHIYVVTQVSRDCDGGHYVPIYLDGDGGWDNAYEYLLPVEDCSDFDAPGNIAVLFD